MKTLVNRLKPVQALVLVVGLGGFMALSFFSGLQESATADEPHHLTSGFAYLKTGRYLLDPIHPPLIRMLAAAPLLGLPVSFPDQPPVGLSEDPYTFSSVFLNHNNVDPRVLLNWGRLMIVLLGGCLGFLIWAWAQEALGPRGAIASVVAFAFSPPLLAYSHYVTTDFGSVVFSFGALYAGWRFSRKPSSGRALVAGLAMGAAFASKFSAFVLLPLLMMLIVVEWFFDRDRWRAMKRQPVASFAAMYAAGLVAVVLLVYKGDQWEAFFSGIRLLQLHLSQGTNCFFYGHYTERGGWPWFIPMVLLLKTPLSFLAAVGAGFFVWRRMPGHFRRFAGVWLVAPCLITIGVCALSSSQFGIRRVLLVYPLLCLWIGVVVETLGVMSNRWRVFWVTLGLWYAGSALYAFPHYLAYFNEAVGGSSQGYRYLLDCNLDWGQGLKSLSQYLRKQGVDHIYLSYFGGADPHAYGIRYVAVAPKGDRVLNDDLSITIQKQKKVLFAISATNREGLHYKNHELFAWLRTRKPVAQVAYSIWVYDITHDADAHRQLAQLFRSGGLTEWAYIEDQWAQSLAMEGREAHF